MLFSFASISTRRNGSRMSIKRWFSLTGSVFATRFAIFFLTSKHSSVCSYQWLPEIRLYCPEVPIVLVGCKKDLRRDQEVNEQSQNTPQTLVTSADVYISQGPADSLTQLIDITPRSRLSAKLSMPNNTENVPPKLTKALKKYLRLLRVTPY
jgi:hypothetical protein